MKTSTRKGASRDGANTARGEQRSVDRAMYKLNAGSKVFPKKLTLQTTLSTNGSGFIPATQITSDGCRGAQEWGSDAARFTQFRVKSIRVRLIPIVDETTAVTVGGGAVTPHPTGLVFAQYGEGLGYGSYASLYAGAGAKLFNGSERIIEYAFDWRNFTDAKLWSSTNAAIPTANIFGVQFQDQGIAPASAASTVYFRQYVDWEVEFMFTQ